MTKNEVLEIMEWVCRGAAYTARGCMCGPGSSCDKCGGMVHDNPLVPVQGNRPLDEYLELCADWAENELRK